MQARGKKLLSLVLALVLVFQLLPQMNITAWAEDDDEIGGSIIALPDDEGGDGGSIVEVPDEDEWEDEGEEPERPDIVGEEEALRGQGEKHFRLSDGTYLAATYGSPIHYLGEDGSWVEIDNRPVLRDGVYQIRNGNNSADAMVNGLKGALTAIQ